MKIGFKTVTGLALLSILGFSCLHAQSSDGTVDLEGGKYPVGFQLIELIDCSRPGPDVILSQGKSKVDAGGREIRMYMWYPAKESSGTSPMQLEDYVLYAAQDFKCIDGDKKAKLEEARRNLPLAWAVTQDQWVSLLKLKVTAVNEALPASESFPLIVLGQGLYYENPVTHFFLCEYLASNGYVVVTSPLIGAHSRLVLLNLVDLEAQVRDMEFLLAEACKMPFVDQDKLGIAGFDMGGMSALLLQMRNSRVNALVTLDSGIIFHHPSDLPGSSFHYNAERLQVPWLHFTQERVLKIADLHSNESLFHRARYSDISLVLIDGIEHVNFTSYSLLGINKSLRAYWNSVGDKARITYLMICRTIKEFLNAHLKGDEADLNNFENISTRYTDSGISIKIEQKNAEVAPPLLQAFVNETLSNGIESAVKQVQAYEANHPNWQFYDEATLNFLGYKFLLFWNDGKTALRIFQLMVEHYPESANAYDSLAEGYMLMGDSENAIANYEKSLELNPENDNARAMLKRLKQ